MYFTELIIISVIEYILIRKELPTFFPKLLKANLGGFDLNKPRENQKEKTPEASGLIVLIVFLISLSLLSTNENYQVIYVIAFAGLIGFTDNVLNLEWKWKIIVPLFYLYSLAQYYTQHYQFELDLNIIHIPLKFQFPSILIQICIVLYAVFCFNAVNIYAGVNGVEISQSIIAQIFSCIYLVLKYGIQTVLQDKTLRFSFTVSILFIVASLALLYYNKFPAKCFVGDVYTYLSGTTYVAAAVSGNYLISSIFFYWIQMVNFLLSLPQLIGIIPCPRHRLPQLKEDGKLYGKKENWNVLNVYLRLVRHKGLTERRLLIELVLIQSIVSLAILYIQKCYFL